MLLIDYKESFYEERGQVFFDRLDDFYTYLCIECRVTNSSNRDLLLFLVYGIGFFFLKEFKKYIPLSAAFFVALCCSIFIYPLIQTAI